MSPAMQRAINQNAMNFDIFHSHNTFLAPNRYVSKTSKIKNIPCFYHTHGALDPLVVRQGVIRQVRKLAYLYSLERRNYAAASALFANTEREYDQIRSWGIKSSIEIVPNGIAAPTIVDANTETMTPFLGLPSDSVKILFIGRIVPKKGLHLLLEAFGKLEESIKTNAFLLIAGDRDQEKSYTRQLDELIRQHQITDNVKWLGFLNDQEKSKVFCAADIFSHVSQSEGMAMSILEAMSYGLPTLVSDTCYMDAAERESAVIECKFSSSDIAQNLETLIRDNAMRKRIGQSSKCYVNEHHSWITIAERVVNIYSSSLG